MTDFIQTLHDQRNHAISEQRTILDAAIAEKRDLSAEDQGVIERTDKAIAELDARALDLKAKAEARSAAEKAWADLMAQPDERGAGAAKTDDVAAALRSILRGEGARDFTGEGKAITRALSVGTATAGGNTAPDTFLAQLVEPLRMTSPLYAAGATVLTTSHGNEIEVPTLTNFGAAAGSTEAAQLAGTDPAFGKLLLKAYKFGDWRAVSTELTEDSALDIEGIVTRLIGENIGILFGGKLSVGVGTTETAGIVTAATAGKTGAGAVAGAFTFDDLIDLQESVLSPYRSNAAFIMSNAAVAAARKMKDGNNQYLWQPAVIAGQPDRLFGEAVYRDPSMEAPGVGKKSVIYGDISKYWIRIVNSVRIESSPHALFGTDQIAFRGVLRGDGILTDTGAVKAFVGGAAS